MYYYYQFSLENASSMMTEQEMNTSNNVCQHVNVQERKLDSQTLEQMYITSIGILDRKVVSSL